MISGFRPTRGGSDSEKEKKKEFLECKSLNRYFEICLQFLFWTVKIP